MAEYRYKLALEVIDHGERSFTATSEVDCQTEMADDLAFDIVRMLRIMNAPPDAGDIARAMEPIPWHGVFGLLAYLAYHWDGEADLEDAFRLTVDVEKLMGTAQEDEKDSVRHAIKLTRWAKVKA